MGLRILPFRQYSDNDVVNLYALENDAVLDSTTGTGGGDAGVFVKVSNGDFNKEPVEYQTNSYLGDSSYPFLGTTKMYPEVNLKITGASSGEFPLGMTLNQTAKNDENGEKLLYNPTKQTELQAVLPGEAVPVATAGVFTLSANAFDGGAALYPVGSGIRISTNNVGKITGSHPSNSHCFGTVIGTGSRTSEGPTTDQFAGDFIVVKFKCK
jgi:hypothetical protein|tara:strand:- start:4214 stop:4846 length:633 start_codon:yes stop_codon:yes gene_type:complete